ncbi:MAG: acyl carrier protein [Coriobacteriia bacterium]|nr:acyl carrier protein [Coriobacteriia bacterium]
MDYPEVEAKFIETIKTALGWEVTPEQAFLKDLNAKSIDIFRLAMFLEKEFGKKIPLSDLMASVTVGDMAKAVFDNL